MNVDKERGWGFVISHSSGEFCIPDGETTVEYDTKRSGSPLPREVIDSIVSEVDDEDLICVPVLSGKRVKGLFARLDFGGYWSPWVWGDDLEDVMEQLDDLYGVYEDYL